MYLFQLSTDHPAYAIPFLFTFHYVSISTVNTSIFSFSPLLFTFHYVSISTTTFSKSTLYSSKFTFHYVSISTDFILSSKCSSPTIYIPLCIYFNKLPDRYYPSNDYIYIPLFIYFNSCYGCRPLSGI